MKTSNSMIDTVIIEYKRRQNIFQVNHDRILVRLNKKYPQLTTLRQEYASMRMSRRGNKNDKEFKKKYEKKYEEFENFLDKCLKNENIDIDAFQYIPLCERCNDTGYIGEVEKKYCSCVIAEAAQNIIESSNINDNETLANFKLDIFNDKDIVYKDQTQRQLMTKMFEYMVKWTTDFPACSKKQLLIIGRVGLGKSYCLNSIAYEIIKKGYTAMMVTSFAINEAAFDEIKKSDSSALNMMRNVDLLLIDDLGSEQILNNITCPTLFNILNDRIRHNLHTIVSTNLNINELAERYGTRVSSRLTDKHRTFIPPINGKDIRSKHNT